MILNENTRLAAWALLKQHDNWGPKHADQEQVKRHRALRLALESGEMVVVPADAIQAVLDAGFCTNECPNDCKHEIAQKGLAKVLEAEK